MAFGLKFGVGVVQAAAYVDRFATKNYVNTTVETEIECHRKNDVHEHASKGAARNDVMEERFRSIEQSLSEVKADTRETRADMKEIREFLMEHPPAPLP